MKSRAVLLAALALTGCGSAKDFSVDIARGAEAVRGEIAAIDGSMLSMLGMKPFVKATGEEPGTYRFTIPAEKGWSDGEVVMWVSETGQGRSRVDVSVDLPQIVHGDKVLSDDKAEDALEDAMRNWAEKMGKGGSGADEVQFVLTGFAIATQNWSEDKVPDLPFGGSSGGGFNPSRFGEGSSSYSDDEPSFGKPMSNPRGSGPSSTFGKPQNDLGGDDSDYDYEEESSGGGWGDGAQ